MKKNHFPLNMKRHDIENKVPTPTQVYTMEEPKMLLLIYKAVFYCLSVLLDIRWNTSHLKNNLDNPVIKDSNLNKITKPWKARPPHQNNKKEK